jgi:hypothetical protein
MKKNRISTCSIDGMMERTWVAYPAPTIPMEKSLFVFFSVWLSIVGKAGYGSVQTECSVSKVR